MFCRPLQYFKFKSSAGEQAVDRILFQAKSAYHMVELQYLFVFVDVSLDGYGQKPSQLLRRNLGIHSRRGYYCRILLGDDNIL